MRMFKKIIITLFVFFSITNFAYAGNLKDAFGGNLKTVTDKAGYSATTDENTALETVSNIINVFLSLLGVIFLALIIYGGYLWMMDQGNNTKMKKAQELITAAVIGLIIIVLAYSISYFVVSKASQGTLNNSNNTSNNPPAPSESAK